MVDFFLLITLAGAGDELQGIKRGVMELADLVAVNKADGANLAAAERARAEAENALHFFPAAESGWTPRAVACSALTGAGIRELWECVQEYVALTRPNGWFAKARREQQRRWMRRDDRSGAAAALRRTSRSAQPRGRAQARRGRGAHHVVPRGAHASRRLHARIVNTCLQPAAGEDARGLGKKFIEKLNCHPERSPPRRTKSKDLRLFSGFLTRISDSPLRLATHFPSLEPQAFPRAPIPTAKARRRSDHTIWRSKAQSYGDARPAWDSPSWRWA